MNKKQILLAAILAIAVPSLTGASLPPLATPGGEGWAMLVHGCHTDIRSGNVREIGRSARHYHRGQDCDTFVVETRSNNRRQYYDCHRDVRTHRIGGVFVRHRHVGENCEIREVRSNSTSTGN